MTRIPNRVRCMPRQHDALERLRRVTVVGYATAMTEPTAPDTGDDNSIIEPTPDTAGDGAAEAAESAGSEGDTADASGEGEGAPPAQSEY